METKQKRSVWSIVQNNAIIILIVVLALGVGFTKNNFFSWNNFINLASNTSVRFIIALGVSGCLITKGTDLSAGRVAGLGACIAGTLLQRWDYTGKFFESMTTEPFIIWIFLLVIIITGLIGIINGCVVSFLKVPPFIATLGMQTLVYGVALVYTGASPLGGFRKDFTSVATSTVINTISPAIKLKYDIPWLVIIALALGLLMWFLYNKTRHGKFMYAIGGNENAAEVSGVNTSKTKILIYMTAGILYGVAGFLLAAKAGGATVNTAMGYELEAIAACTIGGVSTNGGVGKISGILVGVLVFEVLKISLQFLGVPSDYTYIVQGVVIIVAVALDLRKYLAKK